MKIMVTSFRRSCAYTATLSAPDPAAGHRWPTPPQETPGHSQAILSKSFVGSWLRSPGFWCMQDFVCALQESVSPVLCKFCNQISIHTSNLFICASVFFFFSFTVLVDLTLITLNFFPGRLPISLSFILSCGFLLCSFICCMFLCLFLSFNLLCLESPFFRLEGLNSSLLWFLPPQWMGLDHCLVKVSLLANLCLCSGRWSWIFSLWRAVPCTVMLFGLSTGFMWLWAAYLLMCRIVFLICWRIGMGCPAPELAGFWVGLGLDVEMVAFWRAFAN